MTLFVVIVLALGAQRPAPQLPRTPVLIELFTSEGCSSCPSADALLIRLLETQPVAGVDIIPLAFHVDYWDRLGWKDPFSTPAFTRRQQDYSAIFGADRVYTPQLVADGRAELVGSDERVALDAIRKAAALPHMDVRVSASARGTDAIRVAVEAPAAGTQTEPIDIVAVLVEDRLISPVRRGENSGKTLAHSAVVRRQQAIGALERGPFVGEGEWRLNKAWARPNLRVVAFLQGRTTRRVYGAASAPVQ